MAELAAAIKDDARTLGFTDVGVAGIDLADDEARLLEWLAAGEHGELHYMERFGARRARPAELKPGTVRVVSVRLDYWPGTARDASEVLDRGELAYVSRYAVGRDYHRLMRNRLQRLADRIESRIGPFGYRVFVDSGPVMEKPLARNAGLGWIGKHTNLIHPKGGSWFFLGELYTDLPLPVDPPHGDHCGTCQACLPACPTGAIYAPYRLDARRCISYLTIELEGAIPVDLRPLIGNRVYGCDDCQLVCPWNKFARVTQRARLRAAARPRPRTARRAVRVDRAGVRRAAAGQPDPPHRPRALAPEPRGRARQRAAGRRSPRRAAGAPRPSLGARARARRMGAGTAARGDARRRGRAHFARLTRRLSSRRASPSRAAASTTSSRLSARGGSRSPDCRTEK
jgi:epoxyqueuosine reductase